MLLLGIDTCGPSGTVALARLDGTNAESIDQAQLAGRTYSATLVSTVQEVLLRHNVGLDEIGGLVVVTGPGSFTGVRVGLSAAKGLGEGSGVPVVGVSRLAVIAAASGIPSAALDAHRGEIFLRLEASGAVPAQELLAGAGELASMAPPVQIAICDEAASALLRQAWPVARQVASLTPTAMDAIRLAIPEVTAGRFAELALLDGHYLRRSDAEIFGHGMIRT
jgi:tRNA threonylcarbamoyladenosine biosynthesis protein TsaB